MTINWRDIAEPYRISAMIIKDYLNGKLSQKPSIYRALVIDIDNSGGVLDPSAPPGSIRAKVLSIDSMSIDEDLKIFWPLLPHNRSPLKQGEHVYVLFEDTRKSHGLWIARCAEPAFVDNICLVPGSAKYSGDSEVTDIDIEKLAQNSTSETKYKLSSDFLTEEVPSFECKVGDHVTEGSNNTLVALTRNSDLDTDKPEAGTGEVAIVAGRKGRKINLKDDESYVLISRKRDIDKDLEIQIGATPSGPSTSIAVKSDQVRIIAKNGMKVVVNDGNLDIDAPQVVIGQAAINSAMLGEEFIKAITPLLDALALQLSASPTPIPVLTSPAVSSAVTAFKTALTQLVLSKKVKIE